VAPEARLKGGSPAGIEALLPSDLFRRPHPLSPLDVAEGQRGRGVDRPRWAVSASYSASLAAAGFAVSLDGPASPTASHVSGEQLGRLQRKRVGEASGVGLSLRGGAVLCPHSIPWHPHRWEAAINPV
jgi:hypothetical protein